MSYDYKKMAFYLKADTDCRKCFDLKQVLYWIANRIYIDPESNEYNFLSNEEYLYNHSFPNLTFSNNKNKYNEDVEKYLDEAKAKLYLHIKNGDLHFEICKIKKYIGSDSTKWKDKTKYVYVENDVYEKLDPKSISLDGICVNDGFIYTSQWAYMANINYEDTNKLFSLYPPFQVEEFDIHVSKHSGVCFISPQDYKKIDPYWGEYLYPEKNRDYLTSKGLLSYYHQNDDESELPSSKNKLTKGRGPSYDWETFLQKLLPDIIENPQNYKFINKKDFERKIQNMYSSLMNVSAPSEQAIRAKLDTLYHGLSKK